MLNPIRLLSVLSFCLLLGSAVPSTARDHAAIPGSIVVSFDTQSSQFAQWIAADRSGDIAAFADLLGQHTSRGFIGNDVLQAWLKAKNIQQQMYRAGGTDAHSNSRRLVSAALQNPIAGLCVIEYSQPLDPNWLVRKLSKFAFVDFAEPLYRREFLFRPNDPLDEEQYYLNRISAYQAWDLIPENSSAVVAIVDTGYDFEHEDLLDAFWVNPGEDGQDGNGNDRRSNGIDDDNNGFIDDWRGWDFIGAGNAGDNDPSYGNEHGVHVAGVAGATINNNTGIAGVGLGVKILPVKVGPDNEFDRSTARGHEGILYAASLGADVINCSWGGYDYSIAERLIVEEATAMGSIVVAAAGNDSRRATRFPGGYEKTINVAWTSADDRLNSSSNRHATVDISSPGSAIVSTLPGDDYGGPGWNGTSMAAPMVSAAAAMIKMRWPELTTEQVRAQLLNSVDDISDRNLTHLGMFGSGRLNIHDAVRERLPAAGLRDIRIVDANGNGAVELQEDFRIAFTLANFATDLNDVRVVAYDLTEDIEGDFTRDAVNIGAMTAGQQRQIDEEGIILQISGSVPGNAVYYLTLEIQEQGQKIGRETVRIIVGPSYATLSRGEVLLTFTNAGQLGYNDYADNLEGDGIRFDGSENLAYESGLIIATGPDQMLSSVHDSFGSSISNFIPSSLPLTAEIELAPNLRVERGTAQFRDDGSVKGLQVSIDQEIDVYFPGSRFEALTVIKHTITNISGAAINGLYAALFFDWDINPEGLGDRIELLSQPANGLEFSYAYVYNPLKTGLPYMAVMNAADEDHFAFYAFNNVGNDGSLATTPNFDRADKWLAMTNGAARPSAGPADVSMLIGQGPIDIPADGARTLTTFLFGGYSLQELADKAQSAEQYLNPITSVANQNSSGRDNAGLTLSPNPASASGARAFLDLDAAAKATIRIVDALGREVQQFSRQMTSGPNQVNLATAGLSAGAYQILVELDGKQHLSQMLIVR